MSAPSKLSTQTACRTDHVLETDCPECRKSIIIKIDRFKDPDYINWVTSNLCMQYMKEGIEGVAEEVATLLFQQVKNYIQSASTCRHCLSLKQMKACKGNDCKNLMTQLHARCRKELSFKTKTFSDPILTVQPWDLATLYMSDSPRKPPSASDADSTALLSLLENCVVSGELIADPDVFGHARKARNEIVHRGNMELRNKEFKDYTEKFLDVHKDEDRQRNDKDYHIAREQIETLLHNEVQMDLVRKNEAAVITQHFKEVDETLEHLTDVLQTSNDKDEIEQIQQNIKQMAETRTRMERTMEIFNVKSETAEKTKGKIKEISERAEKKRISIETSAITEERDKLAKDYEKTKKMLNEVKKESGEKDLILAHIQEKENEVKRHFKDVEENLEKLTTKPDASTDKDIIENIKESIRETTEKLNMMEQESKEKYTGWICECGLLNKRDSSKCRLCGVEKDSSSR